MFFATRKVTQKEYPSVPEEKGPKPKKTIEPDLRKPKNMAMTLLLILGILALVLLGRWTWMAPKDLGLREFYTRLAANEIKHIKFEEAKAKVEYKEGSPKYLEDIESQSVHFISPEHAENVEKMVRDLASRKENPIETTWEKEPASPFFWNALWYFLPWIVVLGFLYFFLFRQMKAPGGAGSVLSFGKSQARLASKEKTGITFSDVAGIEEAKEEVQEIIEFLKSPDKFKRLGGRIPRGVLLVGPPGSGKTLLAKAIAGEADVPFFSICGSDFVEMFVGVGASRVRDLFKQAKENSPCIVFLDEVDAVGRRRGSGLGGGHDEREQTLNAILVEMDGFDTDEGIIVIAATNRPDVLDPALLRPGRFDREIVIDLPDVKGREEILKVHAQKVKLEPNVELSILARGTPTFSGAELEAIINEAALRAAMKDRNAITMEDLEESRDKVKWGRKKKSRIMEEADKRITAFHESGHALVAAMLEEVEPLHKVTIIPRGMALGATMTLPEKDKYHMQKKEILGNLCVLYAGRIAEKLFCNDISSGAQSDIKRATELARLMVCEWGMSDSIGPINYSNTEETLFLGREITKSKTHSEATCILIDKEVKNIIDTCYRKTEKLISKNKERLRNIAEALLRYETLTGKEVEEMIKGRGIEEIKGSTQGHSSP
jgi:cell division protease FtsH